MNIKSQTDTMFFNYRRFGLGTRQCSYSRKINLYIKLHRHQSPVKLVQLSKVPMNNLKDFWQCQRLQLKSRCRSQPCPLAQWPPKEFLWHHLLPGRKPLAPWSHPANQASEIRSCFYLRVTRMVVMTVGRTTVTMTAVTADRTRRGQDHLVPTRCPPLLLLVAHTQHLQPPTPRITQGTHLENYQKPTRQCWVGSQVSLLGWMETDLQWGNPRYCERDKGAGWVWCQGRNVECPSPNFFFHSNILFSFCKLNHVHSSIHIPLPAPWSSLRNRNERGEKTDQNYFIVFLMVCYSKWSKIKVNTEELSYLVPS